MKLYSIILSTVLCLGGCSNQADSEQKNVLLPDQWQQFSNNDNIYNIGVPPTFEIGKHAVQGVIKGPGFFSPDTDVKIYEFFSESSASPQSPNPISDSLTCTPSLTGASSMQKIEGMDGKVEWGKVDIWEKHGEGYVRDSENVVCRMEGTPEPVAGYVLCSQKDAKTVVICISQMKDDPKMAKDIFETFRWTK